MGMTLSTELGGGVKSLKVLSVDGFSISYCILNMFWSYY